MDLETRGLMSMANTGCISKVVGGRRLAESEGESRSVAPFFSIITVTYNDANGLSRSLDAISVQSYRDFELIVIDGGSTDNTLNVLESRKDEIDYFVSERDKGIYHAINKGIRLARGKVIGLVHADDILAFNALTHYHHKFLDNDVDIVLGDCSYFKEGGHLSAYKPARNYGTETIFRGITGAHEAVFIRLSVYNRFGTYDETYGSAADFKLLSSMILSGVTTATTNFLEIFKQEGGKSFSKDVEFGENLRLIRERAPHVSAAHYEQLLKLKNYRSLSSADIRAIYDLVPELNVPSHVLRALCSTLLAVMLNDDSSSSMDSGEKVNSIRRGVVDPNRILFCVCALKGVAGGAERVLIDIASNLNNNGREVIIGCADGRAGVPYYRPDYAIDLFDIFAPPYNKLLDAAINLERELSAVISRMPREILLVVFKCRELRSSFVNWRQFVHLCSQNTTLPDEDIRDLLRSDIQDWIKGHGARVRHWRGLIQEFKPAITVPFMVSASTEVYLAARKLPTKVVISNHGDPIRDYLYQDDWDQGLLDRALRLFAIMSAEKNLWLQDEFLESIPASAKQKSAVISNPVRTGAHPGSIPRQSVVLGVGRLVPVKRFDHLIKAFGMVSGDFPDWTLELYGKGPCQKELEELVDELELMCKVKLMGTTTRIFDVYDRSAFLVSSSEMEGFGLTVAEALASGLPVIGRRQTAGINFLVRDGVTGLLVDDADLTSNLAGAMRRLMISPTFRRELGATAKTDMNAFSIDRVVQAWDNVLFEKPVNRDRKMIQDVQAQDI